MSTEKKKEGITDTKISRRSMLKWTGGLVAAAAVGAAAGVGAESILRPTAPPSSITTTVTAAATGGLPAVAAGEKYVYTTCKGQQCHESCLLRTVSVDGKIVRQERLENLAGPDETPEGDTAHICAKGIISWRLTQNPNRILYPLKRTGNRGEGKFQRISWSQAMDEIGAKLVTIYNKYGPEAICVQPFQCGQSAYLYNPLWRRFLEATKCVLLGQPSIDNDTQITGYMEGTIRGTSGFARKMLRKSNYFVSWGNSPIMNRPGILSRYIMEGQGRGMKFVQIGLWFDASAGKADQFIGVRGGSDAAMALAVSNILVTENLYDSNYMAQYTVAPFLVRDDNALLLRESDAVTGGNKANYMYWDAVTKSAKSIAPHVHKFPIGSIPDFNATPTVNGHTCKTVWVRLKAYLADKTPAWQEQFTGVPAQTVITFAHELAANRPALIKVDYGLRYTNQSRTVRAIKLVAALNGSGDPLTAVQRTGHHTWGGGLPTDIYYPNGLANAYWGPVFMKNGDGGGTRWRDCYTATSTNTPTPSTGDPAVTYNPPLVTPVHAIIWVQGNNVLSLPAREIYEDKILSGKSMDPNGDSVIVFHEYRMSDSAMWADYIFPDFLAEERLDLIGTGGTMRNHVGLEEPAATAPGECMHVVDFWKQLTQRLSSIKPDKTGNGVDVYFNHTVQEYLAMVINPASYTSAGAKGITPPLTMDRLNTEKFVRLFVPSVDADPMEPGNPAASDGNPQAKLYGTSTVAYDTALDFTTPSGRLEFYGEAYVGVTGDGGAPLTDPNPGEAFARQIPSFKDRPGHGKDAGFPLQLLNVRSRFTMQSQYIDDTIVQQLLDKGAVIRMNPVDADQRGIKEGDMVEAYNARVHGRCQGPAHLSQITPPGTIMTYFAWPKAAWKLGCPNYLMAGNSTPETNDALADKIGKYLVGFGADGYDLMWDHPCEVKKV